MGVIPFRPYLILRAATLTKKSFACLRILTLDHIGAVHEFDNRLVHPLEANEMAKPSGLTTQFRCDMPETLLRIF